jgi:Ca2+-binding RTX toxin-like protein
MIRNGARVLDTPLVADGPDFAEPEFVDLAGIDYVYGGSISTVTSTPHAGNPISGTNGSDYLLGTNADDDIRGFGGNDVLYGLAGHDSLDGGSGADVMAGGTGNDTYFVDDYRDVIWEWGGEGTDTVVLSVEAPYYLPTAVENLVLAGSSVIGVGNDLANDIRGNNYGNSLHGEGGDDELRGEFGDDVLWGGQGNDNLYGGAGQDRLIGDEGADRFSYVSMDDATAPDYAHTDFIYDFSRAEGDKINLLTIDADGNAANGDTAFSFIGTADHPFTAPGQVSWLIGGLDTYILLNTDGDADVEGVIGVLGQQTIDTSWFSL